MPEYSTCIFCNQNDSKPSREDVLARWIAREFPNTRWNVRRVKFPMGDPENPQSEDKFVTHGNLGMISRAPCERCNNTWMSALESGVKPILAPLMHGNEAV